jgi:hypothetical protein
MILIAMNTTKMRTVTMSPRALGSRAAGHQRMTNVYVNGERQVSLGTGFVNNWYTKLRGEA